VLPGRAAARCWRCLLVDVTRPRRDGLDRRAGRPRSRPCLQTTTVVQPRRGRRTQGGRTAAGSPSAGSPPHGAASHDANSLWDQVARAAIPSPSSGAVRNARLARVREPGGRANYDQPGCDAPLISKPGNLGIVLRFGRILGGVAYEKQCAALLFSQAMTQLKAPAHAMTSGSD
jgi:hypothetical protein